MTPQPENTPLVSIVTPSYNQETYLGQTLACVQAQDYPRIEHIVMDGGSRDASVTILANARYERPKTLRWRSAPDGGQAQAVNAGLRLARGTICGWLNSDDLLFPHAVSRVVRHFADHPDHLLVYGDAQWIDADGQVLGPYPTRPPHEGDAFRLGCFLCQPAVFFRPELFAAIGWLDEDLDTAMDYDLWCRAFAALPERIGYIRSFLACSRLHADCKTQRQRRRVYLESMRVVHRHFDEVPEDWVLSYLDEQLDAGRTGRLCDAGELLSFLRAAFAVYRPAQRRLLKRLLRTDRRLAVNKENLKLAVMADGWTGGECDILAGIGPDGGRLVLVVRHERPWDGPLRLRLVRDGAVLREYDFPQNGDYYCEIGLSPTPGREAARLVLSCDTTFTPAQVDATSSDRRQLGVQILSAVLAGRP